MRRHRRYPIVIPAEYVLGSARHFATTVNISSGGILLRTDQILPVGQPIQVAMEWPALLEGRCPLRLLVRGRVIRSEGRGAAICIAQHEFRLRAKIKTASASGA